MKKYLLREFGVCVRERERERERESENVRRKILFLLFGAQEKHGKEIETCGTYPPLILLHCAKKGEMNCYLPIFLSHYLSYHLLFITMLCLNKIQKMA
jgi:hypothetical protein